MTTPLLDTQTLPAGRASRTTSLIGKRSWPNTPGRFCYPSLLHKVSTRCVTGPRPAPLHQRQRWRQHAIDRRNSHETRHKVIYPPPTAVPPAASQSRTVTPAPLTEHKRCRGFSPENDQVPRQRGDIPRTISAACGAGVQRIYRAGRRTPDHATLGKSPLSRTPRPLPLAVALRRECVIWSRGR